MEKGLFDKPLSFFGQPVCLVIRLILLFSLGSTVCHAQDSNLETVFDITRIRIHAIAWSEDPGKRVAVVDDQVLRQGMLFRGANVVGIDPDKVIFMFQGRQFVKQIKNQGLSDPPIQTAEQAGISAGGTVETAPSSTTVEEMLPEEAFPWTGRSLPELSNIRTEPNRSAAVKYRIGKGKRLKITGRQGQWLELGLRNGSFGWIHERLVEKIEP